MRYGLGALTLQNRYRFLFLMIGRLFCTQLDRKYCFRKIILLPNPQSFYSTDIDSSFNDRKIFLYKTSNSLMKNINENR